jgi:uncharacterized protein (TIGR00661 family)
MKILYAINGTGNGHITKSLQIIEELENMNHEVDIVVSGAKKNISIPKEFIPLKGFTFEYKSGKIDFVKTFIKSDISQYLKDITFSLDGWDRIVVDYEPIISRAAKIQNKHTIGVSHQYSFLSDKCPRPDKKSFLSEYFLKNFAPVSDSVGLHFIPYDDNIHLPIIRKEIRNAKKENDDHITVYLPTHNLESLKKNLMKFDHKFEIFTDVKQDIFYNNLHFKPLSLNEFTKSLITCDSLITAAGFETPSEALFLGKKMIVIPVSGQYEQLCNAAALQNLGVRIEKRLEDVKSLTSNHIDWHWENPLNYIINRIVQ